MTWLAGVDGCHRGWFRIAREPASAELVFQLIEDTAQLVATPPVPQVVALDIPIGLPDKGPRECDGLARRRLGPRGLAASTVAGIWPTTTSWMRWLRSGPPIASPRAAPSGGRLRRNGTHMESRWRSSVRHGERRPRATGGEPVAPAFSERD